MSLRSLLFLLLCVFGRTLPAKPLVVSTNTILADLVRAVGGEHVQGACFLPVGLDPHDYEPTPGDLRSIARADLVVVNGLGLESWVNKLVQNSGFRGQTVVASEGVTPLHMKNPGAGFSFGKMHEELSDEVDPHAWQDPSNVRRYVENIRTALSRIDPPQAEAYASNADTYVKELEKLDTFARERFGALPAERRKLVTSHDALAYLGRTYGLTVVSVSGLHPDREPSAKQLANLVKFIRAQNVHAIFVEKTSNPKLVELLAKEAGVQTVRELYTDSLGPPGSPASNYLGMFRTNVETIVRALQ